MTDEPKIHPVTEWIEDGALTFGDVRVINRFADLDDGDVDETSPDDPSRALWAVEVWGWFADRPSTEGSWWSRGPYGYDSRDEAEAEATRVRALAPHLRLTD